MTEELKACPFCGGEAGTLLEKDTGKYKVWCLRPTEKCGAILVGDSKEAIERTWNRRASPSADWVAVGDRLPEMDLPVWLFEGGQIYVGCRSENYDGWLWAKCYQSFWFTTDGLWKCEAESDDDYTPTHWQPLPAPPSIPPEQQGG